MEVINDQPVTLHNETLTVLEREYRGRYEEGRRMGECIKDAKMKKGLEARIERRRRWAEQVTIISYYKQE